MQQRVVPSIVSGEKRICLAISEPYAGMCEFVARGAGIHCVKLCLFSDAALLPSFGVMPRKGSDVAHIKTLARKNASGSHYIVSGVKKWITGWCLCLFVVVATRQLSARSRFWVCEHTCRVCVHVRIRAYVHPV